MRQICGLNLMIIPDEIEELMRVYERRGFFEQLISMMESGLGSDMGGVCMCGGRGGCVCVCVCVCV